MNQSSGCSSDPLAKGTASEDGSRPLDLCLATLRFHPAYAGPAIRFRRYAPGLATRGIRMRVFSGAVGEPSRSAGDLLPPERVDDIPVQRVVLPSAGRDRTWLPYFRALTRSCVIEGPVPDVIHLLGLWTWSVPWLMRMRRVGIPVIYTHTMMQTAGLSRLKVLAAGLPFRFVDRVVVSSSVMRRDLEDFGVRGPIDVIPNGVDLQRFRPVDSRDERKALRERLGLPPGAELVVFIGGFLNRRKGIDVLAEAWRGIAHRPSAHLVLVGPHIDEMRPEGAQVEFLDRVRRLLADSGARDRVHFTGPVESVEDYLRAADVFVFPSRKEGMPNVVLEAFACGIASVLTPFEGLPEEFGRPGEQYELVERDPEALAHAITRLLENPARRTVLGRAGREWAENELDVERSLDRHATLYRELTARVAHR